VQALARIVVMQQLLKISKKLHVVLTVHDAVAAIAREEEAEQAQAYVEECMRWVPKWAAGCPINCESGIGKSYGDC
jgi:DNA polymerase I-like protein with 3'-5' exonuclease and polymerase domains